MNPIDAPIFEHEIEAAYNQSHRIVEKMLGQKYEYLRSIFSKDLTQMDEAKGKAILTRAKIEEEFVLGMIEYIKIHDQYAKMLQEKHSQALSEALIWNKAYRASIQENIEFTQLILEKNVAKS